MKVGEIVYDRLTDVCFLSETKLDDSFNQHSYNVPVYKSFRNDRNWSVGSIIVYVRSKLAARRRPDLEHENAIETIVLDIAINSHIWTIVGVYRPRSVDKNNFYWSIYDGYGPNIYQL